MERKRVREEGGEEGRKRARVDHSCLSCGANITTSNEKCPASRESLCHHCYAGCRASQEHPSGGLYQTQWACPCGLYSAYVFHNPLLVLDW